MTRPIPPHGTYARANGSPGYRKACGCEPCLIARRRQEKRWKVNRDLGNPALIDAAPAREHLATLRQTYTWAALSAATGIAESNLFLIANGSRTVIQRATSSGILAVQPGNSPAETLMIDALGSRRRLQALMTVGHSVRTIATECRIAKDRAHDIALGLQPTVRADVVARITAVYSRLAYRPPATDRFTARTRNLAAARGWHGPLAWDENIDDPNAEPETAKPYKAADKYRRDPDRKREIEHLYFLGESVPAITKQLDSNEKYIRDQLAEILRERAERAEAERLAAKRRIAQQQTAVAA